MAAKSIIQVDVEDSSFQSFNELFLKYQAQVKELPGAWGKTNKQVDKMSGSFADMTAALMAQKQQMADQAKEAEKQSKAEKDAAAQKRKADAEAARAAKKRHDDFKKITKEAEKTAKWVGKTTIDLLKWVTLGTLGLGAAGLFGLGGLANGVSSDRRAAQGFGVDIGQMKSLALNYGRYFDTNTVLENIANSQNDVTKRWAFSAMGVNPTGKNATQLAVEMAPRAKQVFEQGGMTEQSAQAHGLLQFYTMDELRRLHAISMKDLAASKTQYSKDIVPLSLTEATQRRWLEFGTSLDRAKDKIKNTLVDGLTPLIGPLNKLTDAFTKSLLAFMQSPKLKQWMDDLGVGLQKFATYVTSDKFQADVKTFVDDFAIVARKLVGVLKFFNIIPDTPAPTAVAPDGGRVRSGFIDPNGVIAGRVAANDMGSGGFMKAIESYGYNKYAAAGIAGNVKWESGFNPFAKGDYNKKTKHYDAYGIAQWHPDRQALYEKQFGHTMQSVTDPDQALKEQIAFLVYEMRHVAKYKKVNEQLIRATSAYDAAGAVTRGYERPAHAEVQSAIRGATANVYVHVNNPAGAQVSVTGSALPQ